MSAEDIALLTQADVAKLLKVTTRTVRTLKIRRVLPVALCAALLLTGCDDSVKMPDGREVQCVGLLGPRDTTITYHIDKGNVAVAVILSETLIVPIVVAFSQLWCPVATPAAAEPDTTRAVVEDTTRGRR